MRERLELTPKTLLPFLLFALFSLLWIGLEPVSECAVLASIDDGYYYPKIALNHSISGRLTYDNITPTNGFHPLWEFVIIPFYLVFKNHWLALKAVYWLLIFLNLFNLFQF